MKWWPFSKDNEAQTELQERVVTPFSSDIENLALLKYHALRALCGFLFDRHTACRSPHPFCGTANPLQVITHAVPQRSAHDGNLLLAIYFSGGKNNVYHNTADLPPNPLEYIASWDYADVTPFRKAVVQLLNDGTYSTLYGPIINPVVGDYPTGGLDPDNFRTFHCNPEPAHASWKYWESELTDGQQVIPEYRCMNPGGHTWTIADIDKDRGLIHQVAALQWADNPQHNFGIHRGDAKNIIYAHNNDDSEFSKVMRENMSPLWL